MLTAENICICAWEGVGFIGIIEPDIFFLIPQKSTK